MTDAPWHRVVFDLILVAFLGLFCWAALDLRPDSRLVPLIVGVPSLLAMFVRTALDVRSAVRPAVAVPRPAPVEATGRHGELATASLADLSRVARDEVEADSELPATAAELRRQRLFALWGIVVVAAAVLATEYLRPVFGLRTYFLPAAAVGLLTILRVVGIGWLKAVAVTAGVVAFLYLMLGVFLNVRL